MKNKVLVVATSRKTRGGITSVIKAHETGPQWKEYNCEWIETHRDGPAVRKILYFLRGFLKYVIKLPSAQIVHVHLPMVERKMPFIYLAKLTGKKIIVHLHFPDPKEALENPSKARKYGWCIKKADVVVALSETWKRMLLEKYDTDNIRVIYNPSPRVENIKNYSRKLGGNKYILYAGTLNDRKGYRDLLTAFAKVCDKLPDWSVKFAGNGEVDEAKRLARELGIEGRVEFLGWVSGEEKDKAFRNAACYCLPSYAEGFPMGVLDAWAYGLPVLTTPVGGLPDILSDGEDALVFNPGDINGLSEKLQLLNNEALLVKLSDASLQLAKDKFNIDNINKKVGELYRELSES